MKGGLDMRPPVNLSSNIMWNNQFSYKFNLSGFGPIIKSLCTPK